MQVLDAAGRQQTCVLQQDKAYITLQRKEIVLLLPKGMDLRASIHAESGWCWEPDGA